MVLKYNGDFEADVSSKSNDLEDLRVQFAMKIDSLRRKASKHIFDVTGLELSTLEQFELRNLVKESIQNNPGGGGYGSYNPHLEAASIFLFQNYGLSPDPGVQMDLMADRYEAFEECKPDLVKEIYDVKQARQFLP